MAAESESSPSEVVLSPFVRESPINRPHIARRVDAFARTLRSGAHVLDAGAGDAPYRQLFAHCAYVTADWEGSIHPEASSSDLIARLDDLPLERETFDAVLCTEVLEHVARPEGVLSELFRVLAPGGRMLLTTPFVWELHEEPYDFFRYTGHALTDLLQSSGFCDVEVDSFGGWFSVVGQLLRSYPSITGRGRGSAAARLASGLVGRLGTGLSRLDRFDLRRGLPLGYTVLAAKPVS